MFFILFSSRIGFIKKSIMYIKFIIIKMLAKYTWYTFNIGIIIMYEQIENIKRLNICFPISSTLIFSLFVWFIFSIYCCDFIALNVAINAVRVIIGNSKNNSMLIIFPSAFQFLLPNSLMPSIA